MSAKRKKLEMDGSLEQKVDEFQTYPAYIQKKGFSYFVQLPMDIFRFLNPQDDSKVLLQVAVKRITIDEARNILNYEPHESDITVKAKRIYKSGLRCQNTRKLLGSLYLLPQIQCPVCMRMGSLFSIVTIARGRNYTYWRIRHGKGHGFPVPTLHLITPRRFPQFYIEHPLEKENGVR